MDVQAVSMLYRANGLDQWCLWVEVNGKINFNSQATRFFFFERVRRPSISSDVALLHSGRANVTSYLAGNVPSYQVCLFLRTTKELSRKRDKTGEGRMYDYLSSSISCASRTTNLIIRLLLRIFMLCSILPNASHLLPNRRHRPSTQISVSLTL